jgi:hypothetical protein
MFQIAYKSLNRAPICGIWLPSRALLFCFIGYHIDLCRALFRWTWILEFLFSTTIKHYVHVLFALCAQVYGSVISCGPLGNPRNTVGPSILCETVRHFRLRSRQRLRSLWIRLTATKNRSIWFIWILKFVREWLRAAFRPRSPEEIPDNDVSDNELEQLQVKELGIACRLMKLVIVVLLFGFHVSWVPVIARLYIGCVLVGWRYLSTRLWSVAGLST